MKLLSILLSSISTLMVLSTLICGFWLRSQGATPDGVDFHIKLATATVVLVLASLVTLLILALRLP